ncbi:ABC transporter ATP-binding protein [Lacibacterium aquatile]|uniref:ABC transporter ATP-binding protein n=1 Tax=Lacibacterium aquatile TaxID=1168082 RepID=A0ABW5DK10_9PROT
MLEVKGLTAGYKDAVVLQEIGFTLAAGQSLALLGRNGMGKTTLITSLVGATRRFAGSLHFDGQDITALPSHRRAQLGIGWVPQERDIFPSLTVEENMTAVARPGPFGLKQAYEMFPRLAERRANMGKQLSGGEQQMLAMARAMMTNPRLLLLDEPLEGLAPIIVQDLLAAISKMTQGEGMSVILVDQHARQILPITDRAIILERGQVVHEGKSADLLADPAPLERWVGVGQAA